MWEDEDGFGEGVQWNVCKNCDHLYKNIVKNLNRIEDFKISPTYDCDICSLVRNVFETGNDYYVYEKKSLCVSCTDYLSLINEDSF